MSHGVSFRLFQGFIENSRETEHPPRIVSAAYFFDRATKLIRIQPASRPVATSAISGKGGW